jgi:CheY-like chemotaxis protein
LLVEPDPESRTLGAFMLGRLGYTVLEARNASEAQRIYDECGCPVHLLLTEIRMPRVDGYELAKSLAARDPAMRILFLADTDHARRERGPSLRIKKRQPILERPFTLGVLADRVRRALGSAVRAKVLTAGSPA